MNEVSKQLVCVVLRNGIELWVESDRANNLIANLRTATGSKFIGFEDQMINSADIVGVFTPQTMEDSIRRKNGQWKCNLNTWHERQERCECDDVIKNLKQKYSNFN